ncbi:metallophosphoesterase [Escherichia coli]|uniref:metallophosphoesterase n=9 Tax=Escherichia coli TaxID=562 RepID=UPI0032DB735E
MMAPTIYHRIDGTKYRNVWVVGDLHGCYTRLMSELHRVDFDPAQDLLISVGDLIDRGTENVECLELLQMSWFRAVMGNHERLMIDALSPDGNVNNWLMNGGQWFFMLDTDQEILAWALVELVKRLPYIIELNTGQETIVIAHADYPDNEYQFGKEVPLFNVVWARERISDSMDDIGGEISGADRFIFGHTPVKSPKTFWNQQYIDTGAVFCGKRHNKAKSERQELRKQVADLNQQLKKAIKDASEARVAFANKKAEVTALVNENAKFATLKKEMYGITERRFPASKLHPTLGQISFFPRLLAYGISSPKEFNNERPYIVSKLDFAYQFCCDMGYAIDIRINEWLMPNFQPLAIFREFQPEGWVEFFHELICKEMESRRPELVRRVEWAQEVMLADAELPFEPEFIDDLATKGLHTLFDVVTRRHEQLVVELGLEETAARRLLDVCYARSDAWEKENGGTIYVR